MTLIKVKDINRLKKLVEKQVGFSINHRPECERLSIDILQRTGQFLSYNTLRRVFGLAGTKNSSKPTISTLNILANYCGYKSFYQIGLGEGRRDITSEEIYEKLLSFQMEGCININNLSTFLTGIEQNPNYYLYVYETIGLGFRLNDKHFLLHLFEIDDLFLNRNYLYTHIYFSIINVGIQMRKRPDKKEIWKHWAKQENARSFYFELYVDMDFLIIDHYFALREYRKKKQSPEAVLFSSSLLFLRAYMLDKSTEMQRDISIMDSVELTEDIHPIPIARYLTSKMLFEKMKFGEITPETKEIIIGYFKKIRHHGIEGKYTSFFHFWMMEGFVLSGEYDMAMDLILILEKHGKEDHSYYNKGSWERYKVYKAFTLLHHGNQKATTTIFTGINRKKFHPFSYEYDGIFLDVLSFKINNDNSALKNAEITAKKLKYSRLIKLLLG